MQPLKSIKYIILHWTGVPATKEQIGAVQTLDSVRRYHVQNLGWSEIGYHYLVLEDGSIKVGRPVKFQGSHCKARGRNTDSIGVCLVGGPLSKGYPTAAQQAALKHILPTLCLRHNVPVSNIKQHSDFEPGKPFCASLDMGAVRLNTEAKLRTMK